MKYRGQSCILVGARLDGLNDCVVMVSFCVKVTFLAVTLVKAYCSVS